MNAIIDFLTGLARGMGLISLIYISACAPIQKQNMNDQLVEACINMGAPPGSEHYYSCRMNLLHIVTDAQLANTRMNYNVQNSGNVYKLKGLNPYTN